MRSSLTPMLSQPHAPLPGAALAVLPLLGGAIATLILTGCSAGREAPVAGAADAGAAEAASPAAGEQPIGVSPGGVTTRIEVPAQSTEEQYAQACMTAKDWMSAKGGDPQTLVEPYLKEVQTSTASGPATFRTTWADLSEPQRAAVIIAVRAAADGGC